MTVAEYLQKLCMFSGLNSELVNIEVEETERRLEARLEVPEEKVDLFVGGKGETLYSIQHLLRLCFNREYPDKSIILDINNYRQRREERLKEKAVFIGQEVKQTGQARTLRHLNSYERYLVHTTIAEEEGFEELSTESEDAGDQRWLTIKYKHEK
mgnify:CR=1 FL=1